MPNSKETNNTKRKQSKKWLEMSISELITEFRTFLHDLIDIKVGMDQRGSIRNISNNKEMKGANAWLLMCSIMVASLGLDLNSPAVIIGAMLISPLMSPILGIGLGVAINDRNTLSISLKHFILSIIIALVTSTLYFMLTPFGSLTNEIASRTAPNLLDGLVAIFGGLAGIISTTRKDKSNAIPGVAIATALMPPLCVAGYGLANQEWQFFAKAFYLFFLNSFFIATSTYLVIRILGFKYKEYPNENERRRNQLYMIVFSIIILIPAFYILFDTIGDIREKQKIESYIKKHFENENTAIADWDLDKTDSIMELDIQLIGEPVSPDKIAACDAALDEIIGTEVNVNTYQSKEIPFEDILLLKKEVGGFQGEFAQKIANLEKMQQERELKLSQLVQEMDSLQNNLNLPSIFEETKINYPLIKHIGFSENVETSDSIQIEKLPVLFLSWDKKKTRKARLADQEKIKNFMIKRANLDTLMLIAY